MKSTTVYLSLGSNQGNSLNLLKKIIFLLKNEKTIKNLQFSHFYSTQPILMEDPETWFVNAVVGFETESSLKELHALTLAIEKNLGKKPKPKNSPRPIDIDILFFGSHSYRDADLEIPHPRWKERLFVLIPLTDLIAEIAVDGKIYILREWVQQWIGDPDQNVLLIEKNPNNQ